MSPWDLWEALGAWQKTSPHLGAWVAGGFGAALLAAHVFGKKPQPQATHGTARWSTPGEIRAAGLLAPHGVVCGRLGGHLLRDDSETHVLLVAPSRSGKGLGPIGGSLLTWRGSVLVFDPADGENYDFSHTWRAALGQRVAQFTPRRSPHACLNVCDLIRFGTPQEFDDAWTVAASLVAPMKLVRQSDAGQFFRGQATTLLTAGLLHMHYAHPPASLGKLWTLLTQTYATQQACLEEMQTCAHTPHGVHPYIHQLATSIRNITNDKVLGDLWATAQAPLLPYADYLTQQSTDTSTVALEDLQYGPDPLSLYLVAPNTTDLDRLAPIYRTISDMALHRLQGHKARTASHRLLVIADEAPAFGYSRALDKGPAEVAKYGMKLLIVAQDMLQFEGAFGSDNSIFGNTATKIFFAPDSHATAKALSQAWGQATVEQPILSKPQGLGGKGSVSYQHVGQWHMTPDQLRTMHPQACVIDRTGLYPILAGKVDCRVDAEFRDKYTQAAP